MAYYNGVKAHHKQQNYNGTSGRLQFVQNKSG